MKKNSKYTEKQRKKFFHLFFDRKKPLGESARICGIKYANAYMWVKYRNTKNLTDKTKLSDKLVNATQWKDVSREFRAAQMNCKTLSKSNLDEKHQTMTLLALTNSMSKILAILNN